MDSNNKTKRRRQQTRENMDTMLALLRTHREIAEANFDGDESPRDREVSCSIAVNRFWDTKATGLTPGQAIHALRALENEGLVRSWDTLGRGPRRYILDTDADKAERAAHDARLRENEAAMRPVLDYLRAAGVECTGRYDEVRVSPADLARLLGVEVASGGAR